MRNFIPDGYQEVGYIAERKGIYSACRFEYRPMLHGERNRVMDAMRNGPKDGSKAVYAAIEKHLVKWDQRNDKDEPLAKTGINIARLRPEFTERLFNIITGYAASDDDPDAAPKVEPDELESLLEGKPPGDAKLEADAKN